MENAEESRSLAWQPLTPRGVAAFAFARTGRLMLVQFVVALLVAAVLLWFLHTRWFSVVTAAVNQLPAQGELRAGRLVWSGESPKLLAQNSFLALSVDLKHDGAARSPAHLVVEFGEEDVRVFSLFGFLQSRYPLGCVVSVNRLDLQAKWGAWELPLLAVIGLTTVAGLFLSWTLLATIYALPVWVLAFFANREGGLGGSWRLAGAALMPGALLMTAAIALYGTGVLDVIQFLVAAGAHLVVPWIYLLASPWCLPKQRMAAEEQRNPFTASAPAVSAPPGSSQSPPKPADDKPAGSGPL